jgi:heptosyltransferase-2
MKILAVQNRKGIGDTIIFLPFFKAISEKYSIPSRHIGTRQL